MMKSTHVIRVEGVGQKNAYAQKDQQRRYHLSHRPAPKLAMPGRDLRRKARYIALRTMATMIEPRCLIHWDGASPLFQAVVVEEGKWFLRNRNRID
jgi:hypothetical protein